MAKPFIKWVGGKTKLLPELRSRIPDSYGRYYEPFLGGGALFFNLAPKKASLSDCNWELITAYKVVRDNVDGLIKELKKHEYSNDYYTKIRSIDRSEYFHLLSDVEVASRFIYLNKTCFNGLYRVNKQGQFNVPMGKYKKPKILQPAVLKACSKALQGVRIERADFNYITEIAMLGDFTYFDPPYVPLNPTSNFTSYSRDGFTEQDHYDLKDTCVELDSKGVNFMVSNSSTPLVRELYSDFHIEEVHAPRSINSKSTGRGKVPEVIIRNYRND